ncbi:uncharacterized protein LOC133187530 [Saccostrea echinata]|uniref:uncharacterized protein LOC133187530 n=1 Tax=Saccostrea echinata TaxID=191078 RepID=UPI002A83DA1D|nr:uncharacterized protein LOC133187530 [Saccostrea echinata]
MPTYNCSDPNSIPNGYYFGDKTYYQHDDKVYFICHSSYSLEGNPTLTCDGGTGNWSGTYPTCSSTTTTSATTTLAYEEWLYVGVGVMSFLGFLLILIVLLLCLKLCYRLCRKRSRVSALHGIDEEVDVGCCYACCTRCCLKCCKCCRDDTDVIQRKPSKPKTRQPKQSSNQTYDLSPTSTAASEERSTSTQVMQKREIKPAKEIIAWKPHSNPLRNINTSTK